MKICVVGAGAIGGFIGVKLALTGADVTLVARGSNLEAIRRSGMRVMQGGVEYVARNVKATSSLAEAGPQDVVILAMKAHQVLPVVRDIPALLHDRTLIVPMQNGIPWWYFQRPAPNQRAPQFEGRYVESVDPGGTIANSIDPARLIGCVVYPACELVAPGVVRHIEGDRFPLGELDGLPTVRVR
jgi:2-dehydropantoate 2-reductase